MSIPPRVARPPHLPHLLISAFISCFMSAAGAATPVITTGAPSWHLSSGQRLHRGADSLLALGENAVAGRGAASETASWQQLPPGAGLDAGALMAPPAGFAAAAGAPAPLLYSRGAGNTHLRMAQSDTPAASSLAPSGEPGAIARPGLYTMLLIGIGLLLLRMRRNDLHDEKFSV